MCKLILYIKNKIRKNHICLIVFLLILTGLIFVPGRYDVTLPSPTSDINENIYIDE